MEQKKETPWGIVPQTWKISTVKDETLLMTDYVANGSFASLAANVEYKSEEDYAVLVRLVDYNNSFQGPFVFIDENAYDFLTKSKLYGDEIIISNVGANVGTVFKCPRLKWKMSLAPNAIMVKFKGDNDFYYYWLKSKYGQHMLNSIVTGSAQPKFNKTNFRDLAIPVPPIHEQKQIAKILSSLDDKIELNRRINDNLEQQAQALFKAWFVDFEPFKDGKFVDSELGRIPEGWKIVEANYFMTISKESINPTKNPACLYTHYSIPAFDEALTPEIQYGREIKSNKFLVYSGMTLFSKLNPRIKRIWFINEASNNSICSTEFIPYKSLGANYYFLYCYLNSKMFYDQAMSLVNGATGSHQRFHPNETLKFLFAYKKEIVEEFNAIVTPTLKEMSKLSIENHKLTKLRDTLLPRLMSGELNINTITE